MLLRLWWTLTSGLVKPRLGPLDECRAALRRRWFPIAGSVVLRFRRPLRPFQRFELVTRLAAWDEKWCWFEQRFEVDGRLHAVGRVKALLRGAEGNVPVSTVLAAIGRSGAASPDLPETIRLWQELEAAEPQDAPRLK